MERTLLLVKPDGIQRALIGEIVSRFERRGLRFVGMKLMSVSSATAKRHYAEHIGKPFFKSLIDYITSAPVLAMVVEGPNAVEICRSTIGATNPAAATPGSIRGDFGVSVGRNLVHGSDSVRSAAREIKLFFKKDELVRYSRTSARWILE